jgi:alkylhydroperoxidase family enzyme
MASHTAALRRVRVPEEKIAGLQVAIVDSSLFKERELVALELADRMSESGHAVSDELWERLLRHFERDEIIELVSVCGLFNYFNRVNDALHMEITR